MKSCWATIVVLGMFGAPAHAEPPGDAARFWPCWRGPMSTGLAPHGDPPQRWSEQQNIRWKVPIPGSGHATPIVWGDHVYIQTAVPADVPLPATGAAGPAAAGDAPAPGAVRFMILALDRGTGKTVWQKTLCAAVPHEGHHSDGTFASASPVTDGQHLFAYFGSRGLYCMDRQGRVQWDRDFGDMTTRRGFGEGSSPALFGDTVVINWDHEGDSFIVALDKRTGDPRWKWARDEVTSWSTPIIVDHQGRPQVVVNATKRVRSYDLASGEMLWECGGQTVNTIPSPVFGGGLVYAMSGFRGNALQAIRLAGARGDVTGSAAVVWTHNEDTPYVPSPLLYGETLYFLKHNQAILSCLDAASGTAFFARQRLDGIDGVYASPVGAAGRVYIAGRNGVTVVLKHGPQFEVLASNTLDEGFDASPAIAGGELYLRGRTHLYCVAAK